MGGMIRTMKFDLEDRMRRKIPLDHPIFDWLVEHCSWTITSRAKMDDGKTPYQKVRGSNFHREVLGFCEKVLYKMPEGKLTRTLE